MSIGTDLEIPEYRPSILQDDKPFEPPSDLHEGEIKQLIREYLNKADKETLEVVLCVLRDYVWD